ncbi:hypothetical protein C3420_11430 [Acinetobacter sp. ACNIH3]|uniref:hypothetical protein n=1 Tax=unclassified Acinetobacter TaxID=196816 RepID=UPI000CDDED54|nr:MULTISPECIES: hypothetical protein [unclassified Acinetobacter]POU21733.1 hypothetical protein C3420_11430 [Acinetobacter sp. ACNIH3]POV75918.1 hypothetical protein C3421_12665 [Acinetobacter sp. ACNIH4]
MGLLSGEFTEQDLAFDETKLTDPKKFKRGTLSDIGLGAVSGTAKGVLSVSNAASRFVEGDEVADKRMQQVNEAFTPLNQGQAGQVASGITEVVAAGTVGAPLGPYGMAATVGLGTRATEHTKLTQQLGVDQDTADVASNIYGATNAALAFLPVSNVFKKSLVADYAALVVAPTAAGQALTYAEGAYLEGKGYEKQGQQYKDMATDPTAILMNLGIGTTFYAAGRYMNAQGNADLPEAEVHKAEADFNATVEQAQADADVSSMPNVAETVDDLAQHQNNINQAIEQVMKGEKVNISEATGGKLKTLNDVKKYIQANQRKAQPTLEELSNNIRSSISSRLAANKKNSSNDEAIKPFTATGTKKAVYDEAMANGFTDADARTIVALAHFESRGTFSPTVKNPKSSATGVFQFIDSTWTLEGGTAANRHDLNTQIKLGIQHTKSNIKYIEDKTGVVLTGSQIYIPHLLGRGGAEIVFKAIKANPEQSARSVIAKFSKDPDHLMRINGIPKDATIGNAMHFFTKKIDDITAQHYGGTGSTHKTVFESESTTAIEQAPIKPESSYEGTIDRLDLDDLPHVDDVFISPHDFNAFQQKGAWNEVVGDLTTEQLDLPSMVLDEHGNLVPESDIDVPKTVHVVDDDIHKFLDELTETIESTPIPHTAKGVRVKDDFLNSANNEFKPDASIATEWRERQRWEDNKYHKELTRSYTDKAGNTVQELQYRGSYVRRTIDASHKTNSIHVGRSGRSDFKDHKGNKELETALDRIFDEGRAFGYLSQIPKGQQTIDKLVANPDLVISSKKTGEDLTAQQWKDKLIREQDNIQMMAKAMSTLAKCALKQAA